MNCKNCKSYQDLNAIEKIELIGKVNHLIQSDQNAFNIAKKIIKAGEDAGFFKTVTILPKRIILQIAEQT